MTRPAIPARPAPQPNAAEPSKSERYLTVAQVAERLGTSQRFPRRLIAERRIQYVKLGSHVRIAESVLDAYIAARTVEPARRTRSSRTRYGRAA